MNIYKLAREDDLQEWNTPERSEDATVIALAKEVGTDLFICEAPAEYRLEARVSQGRGQPEIFPVTAGKPLYVATVTKVVAGFTLTVVEGPVSMPKVLVDKPAATRDEVEEILQETMRQHGIDGHKIKMQYRKF